MYIYRKELVHAATARRTSAYEYKKYDVTIDKEYNCVLHSRKMFEYLLSLETKFNKCAITSPISDYKLNYGASLNICNEAGSPIVEHEVEHSVFWTVRSTTPTLPEFNKAINTMYADEYFSSDIDFYKNDELYQKFIHSAFFNSLRETFINFVEKGLYFTETEQYNLNNVTELKIKNSKYFEIDVYNGNSDHDDGQTYYHHRLLFSGGFRSLSPKEMGMLAVALSEAFPDYWTIYVERYLVHGDPVKKGFKWTDQYLMRFCLMPVFKRPSREKAKADGPKDIY